ncbi:MAG: peptide deformylase [Chloroflexi bacterium]|nr:peptide deformylase [Chloroflexota bacterium]|tara:strand:+ start:448 stop:1134 length:687 start_codon:yes stop_codon:yes gene_type:complete
MSILQIRTFPDPVLRSRAKQVSEINDDIKNLTSDMIETLIEAKGLGLAANQVGILKRIIVLNFPEKKPMALINPEITKKIGRRTVEEGCLSFPNHTGVVERSLKIKAKALDEHGGRLYFDSEDLFAQVLEHEIDHLNGILFIDHLKKHEKLHARKFEYPDQTHQHDLKIQVEVVKDEELNENHSKYNEKLYSEIRVEKMLEALEKGNLLVDLSSSTNVKEDEKLVGNL